MPYKLRDQIYPEGKCPEEWGKAIIVQIHKKMTGQFVIPAEESVFWVFQKSLHRNDTTKTEKIWIVDIVAEEQAGYWTGRGTIDQVLVLRQLAVKFFGKNQTLFNNFIDFKQAFDKCLARGTWQVLYHYGVYEELVTLLEDLYTKCVSAVRVDGELLEWFKVIVGVRQGCNLSPICSCYRLQPSCSWHYIH
jgi:Reverse transcriptase (RNA-dependent DNA polymerase)